MSTSATEEQTYTAEMPFLDHVRELRGRVYWCLIAFGIAFVVAFSTYNSYVSYATEPVIDTLRKLGHDAQMRVGTPTEAFMTKINVSVIAAMVLSMPVHIYHIISFIVPALTKKERRILLSLSVAGGVLFLGGLAMAYFVVLPMALQFLLDTNLMPTDVNPLLDYKTTLMFMAKMILAFAILFQLPLVLVVLMAFDIVKRETLLRYSRYFIVLLFVASAILTPPDIVSQVCLAVPLIFLYFASIFVAKILGYGNPDD